MKKIYFDTNQIYYLRRIADEANGSDYGDSAWAYRVFPHSPELVQDIRALCYIIALQYEWDLQISTSDAAFSELCLHKKKRAEPTRNAWRLFVENDGRFVKQLPFLPGFPVHGRLSLSFINDAADRVILRHFAAERCDVFLTSDSGILGERKRLAALDLIVMRPSDWLDIFLEGLKGSEDAVEWLDRTLFGIRESTNSVLEERITCS